MLGMLKRHEVEILLKAGHSKAGVALCSVKRIAEEVPVVHVDDAAEREKRRIGRPSIVEDFRKPVVNILEEKPDLPSLEILRRVREAGYQGGKTALYALVAAVRPKQINRARSDRGATRKVDGVSARARRGAGTKDEGRYHGGGDEYPLSDRQRFVRRWSACAHANHEEGREGCGWTEEANS